MPSRYMQLCPNCKSIQKAGFTCGICRYPIPSKLPESEGILKATERELLIRKWVDNSPLYNQGYDWYPED